MLLEFIVDTTGAVERESIGVISRTEPALAKAAIERARHCRFIPGRYAAWHRVGYEVDPNVGKPRV